MAKQEAGGIGVRPPILIISNHVVRTQELLSSYRNNGYDLSAINERAYLLAQERQRNGDPRGWDNDRNWSDAELEIAIKNLRKEHEQSR